MPPKSTIVAIFGILAASAQCLIPVAPSKYLTLDARYELGELANVTGKSMLISSQDVYIYRLNMTNSNGNNGDSIQKIRQLIKDIDFAMLTTVDSEGKLHSRPMSTNKEVEFNGDVWFFTYASSLKVSEINRRHEVNVSYADPKKQSYVSLTGTAEIVRDRQKLEELWQPQLKAWFPKELDEPDIALLKVNVEKAEYWDSPSSVVANAISLVKAVTTGKPASNVGEHEKVDLK